MTSNTPPRRRATPTKAAPADARTANLALVLQLLFHEGPSTRAELSRRTGLSRPTLSSLTGELIRDGIVDEDGTARNGNAGTPGRVVRLNPDGPGIIGIDLSIADEATALLAAPDGTVRAHAHRRHPGKDGDVVTTIEQLARDLMPPSAGAVLGVGVGCPGIIDDAGNAVYSPNLGLENAALAGAASRALGVPVTVVNDADAAILAEHTLGHCLDDVLLVKIGVGVGGAVLCSGRRVAGSRHASGEIGHVTVDTDDGPPCSCGRRGCLEAWLRAPVLVARLSRAAAPQARHDVFAEAGARLGTAISPVVAALDLSEVILAGPPELLDDVFLQSVHDTVQARTLVGTHADLAVRRARFGADTVAAGAAATVLAAQLGIV